MPEMRFRVRWPDGQVADCYSPSRAIADYLAPGATYALEDFLRRSRAGLTAASERVRERYGHPCSHAAAQLAAIERAAAGYANEAVVSVESMERM
jgi:uncharacterized repeat protein (TIGR04042 family)